jgi:ribose transport system substrate-binding protein
MATTVADEVSALTRIFSSSPPKLERTNRVPQSLSRPKTMNIYIANRDAERVEFLPCSKCSYTRSQSHTPLQINEFGNFHSTLIESGECKYHVVGLFPFSFFPCTSAINPASPDPIPLMPPPYTFRTRFSNVEKQSKPAAGQPLPTKNTKNQKLNAVHVSTFSNQSVGLTLHKKLFYNNLMNPLRSFLTAAVFCVLLGFRITDANGAETLDIAVIPKGTSHEFWKSIHAGALKAQQELQAKGQPVRIIWKGPLREDDREQQIQVVENFIAQRIDGMVLAPLDNRALVAPTERAIRARVPVVIIDSALKSDLPASYISTDNKKGGQLGAQHLSKILGGKGSVILLRYQVGSASTEEREAGFMEEIKKHPGIKVISQDQYAGATRDSAYKAARNLFNRYKEVDGIFCPCEPVTIGVLMALKDIGKTGKVQLVGFDSGTQSVEGLKNGSVQGLVVQNPLKMGYLGVMTMVDHIKGTKVPRRIDTGVQVVSPENMNQPEMNELIYPPYEKYLKEAK